MLKNPCYLYGNGEVLVPANLNFGEFIVSKLWENKQKIAFINGETQEELTYGEIAQEAMNVAISLVHIGVRKGDVVAVCSENRREYWSTAVGIACTGAIVTPINMGYTKDELKYVMNISKPKYVFCSPQAYKSHAKTFASLNFIKKLIIYGEHKPKGALLYNNLAKGIQDGNGERKAVDYEQFQCVQVNGQSDTVVIFYSSGTTGLPKGVMLTHLNLLFMVVQPDHADVNIRVLVVTPWYHVMGMVGAFSYLVAGRTIVYLPRFEPSLYLNTIEKYQVGQITVVPPVLISLTKFKSNHDLSSIKYIFCGAAPLRTETIEEVCARFPNAGTVRQGFGMTEATLSVCRSHLIDKPKIGSVGRVTRCSIAKIVDIETRRPLQKFQEGEFCIKGPQIMKGYMGKDKSTGFDEEGFFMTGDIAYYDEEENIFIVGRLKELIKYKGYQVPPAEIEAVLLQLQGVRDAGVIGVEHGSAGEVPLAFIVLQPGASLTENDVKQFVAEKLSNPKHLRGGVRFVSEIPKNPSGKILRNRLREMVKSHKSKL